MAGIYIHIPFCRKACTYCNFHFSTTLKEKPRVLSAILKEINSYPPLSGGEPIQTIYFGGGTPGMLTIEELTAFIHAVKQFPVVEKPEITLEVNPDDVSEENLNAWYSIGINRLSIGIQTLQEEELEWMNRSHDAQQAKHALALIQASPFENFSADLIYGSPLLTDEQLLENLNTFIDLKIPHISCYALTIEPATALAYRVKKNPKDNVDPEKQWRQFHLLLKALRNAGYDDYEISNFALPGFRSQHNSSYWKQLPYTGYGPSAHSFDGKNMRRWNVANNIQYSNAIENGEDAYTVEYLTDTQRFNEVILTTLRLMEGVDITLLVRQFGQKMVDQLLERSKPHQDNGKLIFDPVQQCLRLTDEGKFLADGITADLFADELD